MHCCRSQHGSQKHIHAWALFKHIKYVKCLLSCFGAPAPSHVGHHEHNGHDKKKSSKAFGLCLQVVRSLRAENNLPKKSLRAPVASRKKAFGLKRHVVSFLLYHTYPQSDVLSAMHMLFHSLSSCWPCSVSCSCSSCLLPETVVLACCCCCLSFAPGPAWTAVHHIVAASEEPFGLKSFLKLPLLSLVFS